MFSTSPRSVASSPSRVNIVSARTRADGLQKIIPHYFHLQQRQEVKDQDEARQELYDGLRTLAERVKGPYFAGEQWTAVDMSLAPFVRRFYNLEKYRGFRHEDVGDKWVAYKDQLLCE
jgi:glutathione S-transferase